MTTYCTITNKKFEDCNCKHCQEYLDLVLEGSWNIHTTSHLITIKPEEDPQMNEKKES